MCVCSFCISHDEREDVREALKMIDLISRQMRRDQYTMHLGVELNTYANAIARIVESLPPDPRNTESPADTHSYH